MVWWLLASCREPTVEAPPAVVFGGDVAVDNGLGCGIRGDRTLDCFGDVPAEPPAGEWVRVEVGGSAACALDAEGGLGCWGPSSDAVVAEAPQGSGFLDLAVSPEVGCVVDADGGLGCWGDGLRDLEPLPTGRFRAVSVDQFYGCAVSEAGAVVCFGPRAGEVPQIPVAGAVHEVSVVGLTGCVVTDAGEVGCASGNSAPSAVDTAVPAGLRARAGSLDVGWSHACVLDTAGLARCWGEGLYEADPAELRDVPPGPHDAISAGTFVTCWADAGVLDCVGTEG